MTNDECPMNTRVEWLAHWNLLFLLPHWSHVMLRCDEPDCGAEHGWVMTFGWLFWSLEIEHSPPPGWVH